MSEPVVLSAYDEAWPRIFESDVRSMAIAGMIAKPVVDIMASVENIDGLPSRSDRFWGVLGYEWGHGDDTGRRLIHLHIVPQLCSL